LFIARFVLGLGIGSKSTTVPIYCGESSPAAIRGALVMMWQMWTAFGIMLGYIVDAALIDVRPTLNWRLMLGSTVIAPILVCAQVYFCPESPRWYLKKNRPRDAYHSFLRLRPTKLQAARDLYYAHVNLEIEASLKRGRNLVWEMFKVPRNRRAALASWIVMFMQQFCGVNVIAYYSSVIFVQDGGFSERAGILASLGAGIINWLFALPAVYTIDTFGRRNLLLTTFPLMSLFLFFTGSAFYIPEGTGRIACVALGIYLFMVVYSPGEGPVPFVYASECYPLRVRDIGMSFATGTLSSKSFLTKATTWFFNFVLSITWPSLRDAFTISGAFYWYAAWNIVGWWLVLLFVPETKALTLEELDQVFSVPTRKHAVYQLGQAQRWFRKYILRKNVGPKEELYHHTEKTQDV
jgi:sugar porter (SP) family MFS transporter